MNPIYLEPAQVPPQLCGTYTGKKFKAEVCESTEIPSDAGIWYGGSRDTYRVVRLADGASIKPNNDNAAPWDKSRAGIPVTLSPGIVVVKHSIFSGKDSGLTFYVHPSDAAKMLPETVTLSEHQRLVLNVIAGLKSSYRSEEYARLGLNAVTVASIKTELTKLGLLDTRGAVTTKGRNNR